MDEEEVPSWVRRTKFSHTICHRLDPSRLGAAIPLTVEHNNSSTSSLKSQSAAAATVLASSSKNSLSPQHDDEDDVQKKQHHPPFFDKQRSLSPLPQTTVLSDTFKEAQSSQKRFSTPVPQRWRKGSEKGRWSHQKKEYHRSKTTTSSKNIPMMQQQQFASMKINDDKSSRGRKESTWAKYFDHAGGRVMAVEAEEWAVVDMSKLLLGPKFAHGAHSRLYHGIYMDDPVAVKLIRVPDDDETGSLAARLEKQFTREVTLLSHMHDQNVIKFVAACKNPPVYCIITEYLSEGSLRAYLHKLEHKLLPLEKLIGIAMDIARGMEYVHSQGVIHRDLKPENVLINQEFHMKIADFGIACDAAYCDTLAEDPGTYRWMAPEMIKPSKQQCGYGRKVDVYSFGLILWELVAGTIPYEDMTPIQAAYAVLSKNMRPSIPKDCPAAMQALIEQCWSNQAEKRPEFWQIVKVLEEFETSLARDGTLNFPTCTITTTTTTTTTTAVDHKKGLRHWIHKLGPAHHNTSHMPKPKFS